MDEKIDILNQELFSNRDWKSVEDLKVCLFYFYSKADREG